MPQVGCPATFPGCTSSLKLTLLRSARQGLCPTQPPNLDGIDAGFAAVIDAAPSPAIPSNCRSRRKLVSNSANTPSMSRKALPAAVPVSTGCSSRAALRRGPSTRGPYNRWVGAAFYCVSHEVSVDGRWLHLRSSFYGQALLRRCGYDDDRPWRVVPWLHAVEGAATNRKGPAGDGRGPSLFCRIPRPRRAPKHRSAARG